MPIAPDSVHVGESYLTASGQVRRVTLLLPDAEVRFDACRCEMALVSGGVEGSLGLSAFAAEAVRPVPSDWTPDKQEQAGHQAVGQAAGTRA